MLHRLGFLLVCLCSMTALAGLNETSELIKVGDGSWRAVCEDETIDRVDSEDILANQVCGEPTAPSKGCLDIVKDALPYSEYNSTEELSRLANACRSGRPRGMAAMIQKVIETLPYSQYNSNEEMVDLLTSAAPAYPKGKDCLDVTTEALPYSQYNSNQEMAQLATVCGAFRRGSLQCLESAIEDLPYSQYNSLEEMTQIAQNCQ